MRKRTIPIQLLFLIIVLTTSSVNAINRIIPQDSTSNIIEREYKRQTISHNFSTSVFSLPSQMRYFSDNRFTNIDFQWQAKDQHQPISAQLGDGEKYGAVHVASFTPTSAEGIAWGNAHYKNGLINMPTWNEVSDYQLLYPYITGDSIGGNMNTEEYLFNGGYLHTIGKTTLVGALSYRGVLDYRNIDPRPKNIVGDLKASLGSSFLINSKWNVGIDLTVRKYKQTNKIDFFSELGAAPVYHFVGLGRHYARFFGDKTSFYYNGRGAGGTLSFHTIDFDGLSAAVGYEYLGLKKLILSLNKLPMSNLYTQRITSDLYYRTHDKDFKWGLGIAYDYEQKTGVENIFGDPIMNEYPQIAEVKQFYYKKSIVKTEAFGEYHFTTNMYTFVNPSLTIEQSREKYIYPRRLKERTLCIGNITLGGTYKSAKTMHTLTTDWFHGSVQQPKLVLEEMEDDQRFEALEHQNYSYFQSQRKGFRLSAKTHFSIKNKMILFVDVDWLHERYAIPNILNNYSIKCGLIF